MRLGIDIGTHTARAAFLDPDGRPRLVHLPGGDSLPALARQTMHGLEIGEAAARALVGNAETTICGCTRLMGRAGNLPAQLLQRLPYPVRETGGEALCNLLYAEVRASEVYGLLARALADAAMGTGQPVEEVVLTVPASAEDRFRVQARAAVEAQGLVVRRVLNQPAAALLALRDWRLEIRDYETQSPISNLQPPISNPQSPNRVAVVHCGGGTTEVSIAERDGASIRVLATAGDMLLGGDDFAWAVAEQLNERFRHTAGIDIFAVDDSKVAALGLRAAAEQALQTLCVAWETTLALDHGGGFGRDLVTVVRRQDIDTWLAPLLERLAGLCAQALASARGAHQVDAVVLIGDWAHLPAIRATVARAFRKPVAALYTDHADVLAVYGAALATAADAPTVWDVTPYPLGINCYYDDVELFSPIIAANTPIPTPPIGAAGAFTERYSTRVPNQTSVSLDILQYRGPRNPDPYGTERVHPHECEVLGNWEFAGLHPPRGKCAPFTVTFAIDADGILHLHAEETATGHHLAASVNRGIG